MVVNLDGRLKLAKDIEIFGRINNLFDREDATFGVLGRNVCTGPGRSFDPASSATEQFRGYGAPRGVWMGERYAWL